MNRTLVFLGGPAGNPADFLPGNSGSALWGSLALVWPLFYSPFLRKQPEVAGLRTLVHGGCSCLLSLQPRILLFTAAGRLPGEAVVL